MMKNKTALYEINKNCKCLECGCKGAIQLYGCYDINNNIDLAVGFGGTIPWECLNCNNIGLIDFDGLEGYKKAFETIKGEN